MKGLILISALNTFLFPQENINFKIDSLELVKKQKIQTKVEIDKEIIFIEQLIDSLKYEYSLTKLAEIKPKERVIKEDFTIWEGAPAVSNEKRYKRNTRVLIYPKWREGTDDIYVKVNKKFGWLGKHYYKKESLPSHFLDAQKVHLIELQKRAEYEKEAKKLAVKEKQDKRWAEEQRQSKLRRERREREKAIRDSLRKEKEEYIKQKFPLDIAAKINKGQIDIGWTEQMVILSLGYPEDKNTDTYSWGTTTQLVFKNRKYDYVYLKNGIVTSFSE